MTSIPIVDRVRKAAAQAARLVPPQTGQQLDEIRNGRYQVRSLAAADTHITTLIGEVERLTARVAELETFAYGCDGEGCVLPHSSWCEPAKKFAAEHDGCSCGQPWENSPQPHAGHCWVLNPPRNEVGELRKRVAELGTQADALARWKELLTEEVEELEDAAQDDPATPQVARLMIANLRQAMKAGEPE